MSQFGGIMNREGQSILEIVIVIPFLFILVGLLFRMNLGVQMAINNLQYARSQLFILTANSPEYPRLEFRHDIENNYPAAFSKKLQDVMVLGVSDPKALEEATGSMLPAKPQKQQIVRKGVSGGSDDAGEGQKRTTIRVRETAAICTQLNSIGKQNFDSSQIKKLGSERWPFRIPVCYYGGVWIGDYE
jgi:hypothetical protein